MKTILRSLVLTIVLWLPASVFGQYFVTNDLQNSFTLLYYTNNGTTNVFSLSSNTPPGSNYVVSITTNGSAGLGIEPTNGTMFILMAWTNMPFGTNFCSSFFTNALAAIAPAAETVPQWQSILKSYFITGAVPSEQNYWETIDTLFFYINQSYLNSLAAASNAVLAATRSANVFATTIFTVTNFGNTFFTGIKIQETNGFNSSAFGYYSSGAGHGGFRLTNYFTAPLTNPAACYFTVNSNTNTFGQSIAGMRPTLVTNGDTVMGGGNGYFCGVSTNYFWMIGDSTLFTAQWSSFIVLFYQ
jgi:hypothetical protein